MSERPSLRDIGVKHSPSKLEHGYERTVEKFFAPIRDKELTILELGVKRGNSLRMYEEYFPNAQVIGVDILDRTDQTKDRVTVYQGKQQDTELLQKIVDTHGRPDIVIDDGSHRSRHQIPTFMYMLPRMNKDGIYICEDLHFISKTEKMAAWCVNDKGQPMEHEFVTLMNRLNRFLMLSYRNYYKSIPSSEEERTLGRMLHAIHYYGKMILVERR